MFRYGKGSLNDESGFPSHSERRVRALLIGPAASRAPYGAASALVLDAATLDEGTVPTARGQVSLYLRVHAPDDDLAAASALRPDGIVLARCEGGRDVARLGARLAVLEAEAGLADGATGILAMVGTARGVLGLSSLAGASPRLAGIAWDAEALAAGIGAPAARDAGGLIPPLLQARGLVRLAAAAAGVEAIDTAYPAEGDGLLAELAAARRDGFGAKLARSADHAARIASR